MEYIDKINNKVDTVLQDCDDECEEANYHGFTGLASDIFEEIKPYLEVEDYIDVAKVISKAIINKI
jgi:hypothetical protein